MTLKRKSLICELLKGIETGDAASVSVVNPDKYIQHNPQTQEGGEGLAALFKRLAKSSPRVNIVRVFSDGDYIFAHTEYDFSSSRIGFEVFRFEGDLTVEHWDNIQLRKGPNLSGHTMVDGMTNASDLDRTESNRKIVRSFVNEVLIGGQIDALQHYIDNEDYTEHNPHRSDGMSALYSALSAPASGDGSMMQYQKLHRVLAEGDFALSVCEGFLDGVHTAFYDLYRVADGKLVEHWDTIESVPPASQWKNDNGKF